MPLRAPGASGDVLILQRPYEKRSGSEGFVRSIATFSAPPGPRPAHNRPRDTSCLVADLGRAACDGVSIAALSELSFPTRIVAPPAERTPTPSVGNQEGWNVDSRRVVAVVPIANVPGDLVCPTNPVPQQMPWSRRWTARGGGHRLNLLARLPKGWQMRRCRQDAASGSSQVRACCDAASFPDGPAWWCTDASAEAEEVNIDH